MLKALKRGGEKAVRTATCPAKPGSWLWRIAMGFGGGKAGNFKTGQWTEVVGDG